MSFSCGHDRYNWRQGKRDRQSSLFDFLEDFEKVEPFLMPFFRARLGICEEHGTFVDATMDEDGEVWLEHVLDPNFPLTNAQLRRVPNPIRILGGTRTQRQRDFIAKLKKLSAKQATTKHANVKPRKRKKSKR
jgi:hypothetical protein